MNAVITPPSANRISNVAERLDAFALDEEKRLTTLCFSVFDFEKAKMELGDPSEEERQQFLEALKQLKGFAELIQQMSTKVDLDWLIKRLSLSIDPMENPMTTEEANAILDKHFPP